MRRIIAVAAGVLAVIAAGSWAGPAAAAPPEGTSGSPSHGALAGAFDMPLAGAGYRFYGPVAQRQAHYATLELAALIARAARVLRREVPGPPLVLGDMSAEHGGPLRHHASHQSGRDIDVIFLARDPAGAAVEAARFVRFDGAGRCVSEGCEVRFDVERNWWFVRTLVVSTEPAVQWIFVSEPLAKLLLDWARAQGEHPTILARARRLLKQPGDSAPHDDHFHVRIYCPPRRAAGCVDAKPRWPWVSADGRAAPIGR
ncbi:MAG: hypothetical protein CVU56_28625 [Deltaproteobacteria bacterium HGW-Deltaproteobacteria-14]|jgi:penicillin-insensitive murein endopeptidase|nr:MAG: hypothetical protein CVU56_28625 [Deltaproteobacteria bacterium HGW-Deltaproteobacteria-14]